MTVEELWQELGDPQRPETIWQEPFDYDPAHFDRLCQCQADGKLPEPVDVLDYAHDLSYVDEIQADLFVFLLPVCLRAWSLDLRGQSDEYGGAIELFWHGLNKRPGALSLLSEGQASAVDRYMRESILAAIDDGCRVGNVRRNAPVYRWISDLCSYATVFPGLRQLWSSWWNLSTDGRALGALQYISCLTYEVDCNRLFAPWTRTKGGGPPCLWEDSMAVNNEPWDSRNIDFLRSVLVPDELGAAIYRCQERLSHPEDREVALKMKHEFESRRLLLEQRIGELLSILAVDHYMVLEWTI